MRPVLRVQNHGSARSVEKLGTTGEFVPRGTPQSATPALAESVVRLGMTVETAAMMMNGLHRLAVLRHVHLVLHAAIAPLISSLSHKALEKKV